MIAEASVILLLKSTVAVGGSAWAVLMVEGDWLIAAISLPTLVICGLLTWHYSHRLRGIRGEGGD